ncbi:MAG: Hsp20/alpha crystallin family protein [candidate division WOR-3 bacterium]
MAREIVRWDPFKELENLRREMERLFDAFISERRLDREFAWAPAIEVKELPDKYILKVDVPGVKKEDLKLEVSDNVLTISGERKEEKEEREAQYYRREILYGSFQRSIQLPSNVEPDKISAKLENGVLTIEIPKTEKAKAKEIPIK